MPPGLHVPVLPAMAETPQRTTEMTVNAALPLAHGLTAIYHTKADIARQRRAEARKKPQHNDDQLQLDEETNATP
jgi:hypothetical protein